MAYYILELKYEIGNKNDTMLNAKFLVALFGKTFVRLGDE